ncbi:hypothetical protein F5884DRAFT_724872 [Xylogone sp. PMI_703]|nr:hypothetical protein F5884DRAFT_724872 [Xylogone sp. PMI_703]
MRSHPGVARHHNGYRPVQPRNLGLAKILLVGLAQLSSVTAAPLKTWLGILEEELPKDPDDPSLWIYLLVASVLVLLGGAFAGLTIALMGQDGVYLQVIATSGEGKEQKHAKKVFDLLQKGKHWVLVTLLLSNVIVNETLPIVLDRSLGGGWPAVLGSTVLIVIFGEVIPQSICVRYGLSIGAFCAPFVLGLMWVLAPVAWPTAKLLDKLLGEDHGTVYKKSGLKTLVTLHKTLGTSPNDRLNQDEVTIISAVLDLKEKPVGDIMTPMEDVFTMSADTILDEETMDTILSAGYSRIPIHEPGNDTNFIGMLLVKILITYDPEDCKRVGDFALATLPETRPETSCLDIVNFFQEGKSHMVLVSDYPGENYGALGVVTLEDVIEELIGEEIIDESDVYIDVHKAIRRMAPAPKARVQKGVITEVPPSQKETDLIDLDGQEQLGAPLGRKNTPGDRVKNSSTYSTSPKATFLRRTSNGADGGTVAVRANVNDIREHLKHLGPSNLASRPKTTRYSNVKIKLAPDSRRHSTIDDAHSQGANHEEPEYLPAPEGGEGEGLLRSGGRDAKDGVQAVQQGYGTLGSHNPDGPNVTKRDGSPEIQTQLRSLNTSHSDHSSDTLGSANSSPISRKRQARSGSITENLVETGGFRKMVLETNSKDDVSADQSGTQSKSASQPSVGKAEESDEAQNTPTSSQPIGEEVQKKNKKKKKKNKKKGSKASEDGDHADGQ